MAATDAEERPPISARCDPLYNCRCFVGKLRFVSVCIALTNIPVGELLTGFAMRSDPNVVFG